MIGKFSWNGIQSDALGVMIESYPDHAKPVRKVERFKIPGRNGDLIISQDAWENVKRTYDIVIGDGEIRSIAASYDAITEWLCAPKGYCELWDDFDPGHYRLATLVEEVNLEALTMGRAGRARITFDCKPQRYLISGKSSIEYPTSPAIIRNDTKYASRPLIFVEKSADGYGTVTVGKTIFSIYSIPDSGLYIECEEMNCYRQDGTNYNGSVGSSTSEFATLEPGVNNIGFSGVVSKVTITPRWFEI